MIDGAQGEKPQMKAEQNRIDGWFIPDLLSSAATFPARLIYRT
jgi:hypothetical protein